MGRSIFDLPGPSFLGLYAFVAALVLVAAYFYVLVSDPTRGRPPPKVPARPDAIALAWLAGGVNNVIRTLLFDLRRRGFIGIGADGRLEPQSGLPTGALDPRASRLLAALRSRPKVDALFADRALAADLGRLCERECARLSEENLLRPAAVDRAVLQALAAGTAILLGLAATKLFIAISQGRPNIAFLAMMAVLAEVTLVVIALRARRVVASARGRAFLKAIELAYGGRLIDLAAAPGAGARAYDAGLLFLVGVFGYEALANSADLEFASLFKKAAGDSSGSCGSSCSSSSSDGGGGCGGCGGGGGD